MQIITNLIQNFAKKSMVKKYPTTSPGCYGVSERLLFCNYIFKISSADFM